MTTCATGLPIKLLVYKVTRGRHKYGYAARVEAAPGYALNFDMSELVGSGRTSDAACRDLLRQVLAKLPCATTATTNQRVTISYAATGTTSTATLAV